MNYWIIHLFIPKHGCVTGPVPMPTFVVLATWEHVYVTGSNCSQDFRRSEKFQNSVPFKAH